MADALFREARELMKTKNYTEACPKLAESYRLDPAPGTLYNLAECEERQGRLASSLERWRVLVDLLTASGKLTDPRLPVARLRVATLTKRAPQLTLKVKAGAPAELAVIRDGIELRAASLGVPLPADPGEHLVIVRAAYRRDGEYRFSLKEGEEKVLEIEPGPPDGTAPRATASPTGSATAPPTSTAPPGTSASAEPAPTALGSATLGGPGGEAPTRRTVGLVVGGVGAASLLGAGVTGLLLSSRKSTVEEHCNATTKRCDPEGLDAARSGKTLAPVNLVLWVVGAVGVGAGAYLFFSAPGKASTQVGVSTSGRETSVSLSGRFLCARCVGAWLPCC